jgi:5'-nucleotidase
MSDARRIEVDTRAAATDGGPPRILVTNDDGIESPGLRRLATELAAEHEVIVVAPASDMSGSGTGIGRLDRTDPVALKRADFDGVEAYAVAGPPGLAVMSAALGAFGAPPDLVVSGVNAGMNTGHSIIHSGTVGAALTAHTFGSRGIAFSLAPSDPWRWDTAVPIAREAMRWILECRPRTTLNVNIPAVDDVRGVRWAKLDEFGYFRVASADVAGQTLQLEVGDRTSGRDPESDTALCLQGFVTLTPLSPVQPAEIPDVDPYLVVPLSRGSGR